MLAKLFILHVFSKHGIPLHVTSNYRTEFVSTFFRSLSKVLDMKLHFTSGCYKFILILNSRDCQNDIFIEVTACMWLSII